jgi:hypothetical protein
VLAQVSTLGTASPTVWQRGHLSAVNLWLGLKSAVNTTVRDHKGATPGFEPGFLRYDLSIQVSIEPLAKAALRNVVSIELRR